MSLPNSQLDQANITWPHPVHVCDYYLGGKDNYASDRQAAEEIYIQIPDLPEIARDNRAFLQRAVRAFAETGIRQFIDVGAGLPTQGNVHEIAQQVDPTSRVVYIDNDHCKPGCTHALARWTRRNRCGA